MKKKTAKMLIGGLCLGIILLIIALAAMPPKTTDSSSDEVSEYSEVSEPPKTNLDNETVVNIAINWLVENGYITRDEVEDYFFLEEHPTDFLPKYGSIWDVTICCPDVNYWVLISDETGEVLHVDKETERGVVEVYSILTPEEKEKLGLVAEEEEEEEEIL